MRSIFLNKKGKRNYAQSIGLAKEKESMLYLQEPLSSHAKMSYAEKMRSYEPEWNNAITELHQFSPSSQPKGKNGDMRKKVAHQKQRIKREKLEIG